MKLNALKVKVASERIDRLVGLITCMSAADIGNAHTISWQMYYYIFIQFAFFVGV